MDGASQEAIPRVREQVREVAAALANAASLRGIAMVISGTVVLLLPDATTSLVQLIAIAALGATGLQDLFYSVSGRRWFGRRVNRVLAAVRGLVTAAIAVLVGALAWLDTSGGTVSLAAVVATVGIYVTFRGLLAVGTAVIRRDEPGRLSRLAGGAVATVLGALAVVFPASIASSVIVSAATAAIVVGFILIAWGLRRAERGGTADPARMSVGQVLWDWIRGSDVGDEARATQVDLLYFENPGRYTKLGTWWVMLALSVAIATYAILADSTAVVIGAMLVAPLMTPIVALAAALVNGWARRAFHSALLVGGGTVGAIVLAFGLAAWSPVAITFSTNTQIVSRVNPSTVDMLIAIAAGAAGAYATVNTRVSSSIAGVAIAVALVPPLAVVGVTLSGGRVVAAGGALLLFLTNFVAIVLSAATVFVLTGFARPWILRRQSRQVLVTVSPFVVLAGLLLLPLTLSSEGQLATSSRERSAELAVEAWLGDDALFLIQSVSVTAERVEVTIEGSGEPPPPAQLQEELTAQLGTPVAVRLIVIPVEVTDLPAPPS